MVQWIARPLRGIISNTWVKYIRLRIAIAKIKELMKGRGRKSRLIDNRQRAVFNEGWRKGEALVGIYNNNKGGKSKWVKIDGRLK